MEKNTKTIHTNEYRELIKKLVNARKKAQLTQKEVANFLNCSQSYISKIENNQIKIDPIILRKFSKLYQTDIDTLMS